MEIKRERGAAILAAGHKIQDICKAENVGKTLVYKVNTLVTNGRDLNRKSGSGRPANMEQKGVIVATVKETPTAFCSMVAKAALGTSKTTVWRAVRDTDLKFMFLGAVSCIFLYNSKNDHLVPKLVRGS
ncbi:Hypothetical protein FKW44_007319 [Caligus rogercresseyi]|uniref:Uncharacterized protein n=1 Tax=Caligus rogercresseyi TaxID=217165 RepID=A0A7T8KEK3_CALRO|nr:Hypothetical protein FKW44_007319 [Caligus rogercresseyi]